MGYTKIITYGKNIEIYEYEEQLRISGRFYVLSNGYEKLVDDRKDTEAIKKERVINQTKRKDNARRAGLAFRRLVAANLGGCDNPILASFTYAKNITSIQQGHEDFKIFTKRLKKEFGESTKYIAVPEFQQRGAIHFHALIWGLPSFVVGSERSTRLVSSLWQQGFVDLKETDGNEKLSGYLSKYMSKAFVDSRLMFKKAYTCSRNVIRPVIESNGIISQYFYDELSTPDLLQDITFLTQWMGKGRYRHYQL